MPDDSPEPSAGSSSAPSERKLLSGSVTWAVAWRFLRNRRSRLLDGTARAALLATGLGVAALVVTMALMSGYRHDLQNDLIAGNAAIVAYPLGLGGSQTSAETLAALAEVPGIVSVGTVAYGQGSLSTEPDAQGARRQVEVTLRGVDPGGDQLGASRAQLATDDEGAAGVVLGRELLESLGVSEGEILRLVALGYQRGRPKFRYATVRIAGSFSTGFAEFDQQWAVVDRAVLRRLMGVDGPSDLLEFAVEDPQQTDQIVGQVESILGTDYLVGDWRQFNEPLFTALELQQITLFIVLGLIVLVSTFNTASTLVVLVRERMREVGMLSALGLSPRGVMKVFVTYGGLLAGVGTLGGVIFGVTVSWVLTTFELIRFDPEVAKIYFLSSVPFRVQGGDLAAVVGFTLAVTLLACLVPAWKAARIDPASALRYE